MSPSPADVGYRSSSLDAGRNRELSTSLPTKESGLQWNERSGGSSQSGVGGGGGKGGRTALSRTSSAEPVTRGRPPPVSTSLPSGSGTLAGCGPVNMPSSISVQELKQMTALRMAHEQGHLRVVSPFRFSGKTRFPPCYFVAFHGKRTSQDNQHFILNILGNWSWH